MGHVVGTHVRNRTVIFFTLVNSSKRDSPLFDMPKASHTRRSSRKKSVRKARSGARGQRRYRGDDEDAEEKIQLNQKSIKEFFVDDPPNFSTLSLYPRRIWIEVPKELWTREHNGWYERNPNYGDNEYEPKFYYYVSLAGYNRMMSRVQL